MSVRVTSIEAYRSIKKTLGNRQRRVLEFLSDRDMTNRQLSKALGWEINSVTGRVKELRDYGKIEEKRKVICEVTGRKVSQWGVKEFCNHRGNNV